MPISEELPKITGILAFFAVFVTFRYFWTFLLSQLLSVYEGFAPFSNKYRRREEKFTPPVVSYRRKTGVSVTGGYVYRGTRSPSYVGAYIFSDFESKTIWAMKQENRKLTKIRKIGMVAEKPASFGIAADGELFIVGYQGTIFRLVLDQSVFE